MKTKLILLPLLALTALSAEEPQETAAPTVKQEHGYVSFGLGPAPIPLPIFSGGYRMQSGHHGADASLQVSTVVSWTLLKANGYYLHYFNPCATSEFYAGGGVTVGSIIGDHGGWFTGPEFVFGKQYLTEGQHMRFLQMQVTFPTVSWMHHHHVDVTAFPMVALSYGWGF